MAVSSSRLVTVGRASDNDLVVAHPSVSAHHAELHFDGEEFLLRDLSSSNGTFVNGVRITSATLNDGDIVHLGPVALEFINGQLQIRVDLDTEPDAADQVPVAKKKRPVLVAGLLLAAGLAIAIPVLLGQSEDTDSSKALTERPVATAQVLVTTTSSPATTVTPTTAAPTTTVAAPTTVAPATTVAAPTTVAPATTVPATTVPATTAAPTTTTESPAEIAAKAILTASYQWGYSGKTGRLQALLAITADGYYGDGTRTTHVAELNRRGLSTFGVPSPPPTTTSPPTTRPPATTTSLPTTTSPSVENAPDWETLARSVVFIWVDNCGGNTWTGSGTVVLDGGYVLTNAHVVADDYGNFCDMWIYAANSASEPPLWFANGRVIPMAYDPIVDLAVIKLVDTNGFPTRAIGRAPIEIRNIVLGLGDEIKVLGYPGMGGEMITMTSGEHSGWFAGQGGDYYKTSAKGGPGVSGGAAFDALTGEFVGVPTAGTVVDSGDTLGLIRPNRYILQLLVAAEQSG